MKAINKLIACEELNFRFLTQSKALATIGMSYDEIKKSKEATDRENEFLKNAIKDVVNEKNMWKENHEDTQKQLEKSRSAWGSLFSTKSVVPFCLGFLSGFVIANSLSK